MLELTPEQKDIEDASNFAKKYDEGGYGKNVLGVSRSEYISFIRIGKLCELAFVRYLISKNIDIDYTDILVPVKGEKRIGPDLSLSTQNKK